MTTRGRRRAKRRTSWVLILLGVLAASAAGYVLYTRGAGAADEPEAPVMQTATVRRGDIVLTAVGSGNLMPAAEVALGFRSGGTLVELTAAVGDIVEAGEVLARLDDAALRLQHSQAELAVEQAQAKLLTARTTVSRTVEIAEATLAAAQADYDALLTDESYTGARLTSARVNLEQAREAVVAAQTAYDVAWDSGRDWELSVQKTAAALENERAATVRGLERAQDALEVATAAYSLARVDAADDSALQAAWVKVLDARRDVDDARSGSAVQEAAWAVEQAELALAANELSLESTVLHAPFAGTISSVSASPGEAVGTTPVLSLVNLDDALVRFYLEEGDLANVSSGYAVTVVFDALPEQTFTGTVTRVDPALVSVDGTPAVQAWARLALRDAEGTLPTGLTATVEVIAGEAYKALLVPVQALRELAPGQVAVFVVGENDELRLRPVEVGLRDFANAQILSGLEQGDVVSTGTVETE